MHARPHAPFALTLTLLVATACSGGDDFLPNGVDAGTDASDTSLDARLDTGIGGDTGDDSTDTAPDEGLDRDVELPPECGDGVRAGDEECDRDDLGLAQCDDFGMPFGDLACAADCTFDTSACRADAVCGDNLVEGDEECDDGNLLDFDGCDADCLIEVCDPEGDSDGDGVNDCEDVEICDGLDNNGNGAIDEFPVDDEIGLACYTGPDGTEGVGICTSGTIQCVLGELTCVGDVTPQFDELCNDLDDDCDGEVPPLEVELGCSTEFVAGDEPSVGRFEIATPPRAVDIVLNIDTTGSMAGELDGVRSDLRDVIVPGIREVLTGSAFGVTTFDDYPVGEFGDSGDLPFRLWQRVTLDIERVQAALDEVGINSGNDSPESGLESLYQIATGNGTSWLGGYSNYWSPVRSRLSALAYRDGLDENGHGDVDDYALTLEAGQIVQATVVTGDIDGTMESTVRAYDASGTLMSSNDGHLWRDSRTAFRAPRDGTYIIRVSACCDEAPGWGSSEGFYGLIVTVDGVLHRVSASECGELEVGESPTDAAPGSSAGLPVLLPRADGEIDESACRADCASVLGIEEDSVAIDRFCSEELVEGVCGDFITDEGEECDDGNTESGDGCDSECRREPGNVPAFNPRPGFSESLGHGRLGGVGFRAGAVPVIVHVTDAVSHVAETYVAFDPTIEAHDAASTFASLEDLGARVIGIASTDSPIGGPETDDPQYLDSMVRRTGATVPVCAFDESLARLEGECEEGECCTGLDGEGVPAEGDGVCPLVFRVASNGSGLSRAIVDGIRALGTFRGESLTARVVPVAGNPERVTCLVSALEVEDVVRTGDCLPPLELADLNGDGLPETLLNATPSTRATFRFVVQNRDTRDTDGDGDRTERCLDAGDYALRFELVDTVGSIVFAQRLSVSIPE